MDDIIITVSVRNKEKLVVHHNFLVACKHYCIVLSMEGLDNQLGETGCPPQFLVNMKHGLPLISNRDPDYCCHTQRGNDLLTMLYKSSNANTP